MSARRRLSIKVSCNRSGSVDRIEHLNMCRAGRAELVQRLLRTPPSRGSCGLVRCEALDPGVAAAVALHLSSDQRGMGRDNCCAVVAAHVGPAAPGRGRCSARAGGTRTSVGAHRRAVASRRRGEAAYAVVWLGDRLRGECGGGVAPALSNARARGGSSGLRAIAFGSQGGRRWHGARTAPASASAARPHDRTESERLGRGRLR